MNQLIVAPLDRMPALVAAAGSNARTRYAEFFVSNNGTPNVVFGEMDQDSWLN
jgi:hypothetical protein